MKSTDEKVGYRQKSKFKDTASEKAANTIAVYTKEAESILKILEGRWKLVIIFHLFVRPVLRFSELERAMRDVSQKMLIQQLRQLEIDGVVAREIYPEIPPKVEYTLTEVGKALCPLIDAMLKWGKARSEFILAKQEQINCK
jgi:DNA-binding HxlR family transcriptional regulator